MDYSLPDSSIHGISQAIILEWVAISFSRGSSWPRIEPGSPALLADSLPSEPPGYLPISSIYIIWNFQLLLISILHLTLRLWIKIKTVEDEKICFQQMTIHKETLKIQFTLFKTFLYIYFFIILWNKKYQNTNLLLCLSIKTIICKDKENPKNADFYFYFM